MTKRLTRRALREELPGWGVLLLESHHDPAFTMEWRTHPFIKIVYVLKGHGEFLFDQETAPFAAGDVIVVPPQRRNRIVDDPAAASSLYVCCVATALLDFDKRLSRRLRPGPLPSDGHFANRVAALMRRMVHVQSHQTDARPVAMVADALRMIQLISERAGKHPRRQQAPHAPEQQAVAEYIDRLPSDFFEATTVDAAAAELGMPRRTFTRLFSQQTGQSWLRYVRGLAVEHAKRRLRTTDLPIVSVAFECGFNDLSTFYRQFKSGCGMSPGEYRKRAKHSVAELAESSEGAP